MQPMRRLLLIACALLAITPLAAVAGDSGDGAIVGLSVAAGDLSTTRGQKLAQGGGMSLNQAVEQVKRQCKGCRIISAETKRSGNREVHHIKALTKDNKVKTFRIQGRTLSSRG